MPGLLNSLMGGTQGKSSVPSLRFLVPGPLTTPSPPPGPPPPVTSPQIQKPQKAQGFVVPPEFGNFDDYFYSLDDKKKMEVIKQIEPNASPALQAYMLNYKRDR